jgi:uncharacterized protein YgbK (DUF1537 family)
MIIIGGGFTDENLQRIAKQVSRQQKGEYSYIDINKVEQAAREVFSRLSRNQKREIGHVESKILTPDQEIEVEELRQRVKAILNKPPVIRKPY